MRKWPALLPVVMAVGCSGDENATHAGIDGRFRVKPPQIMAKAADGFVDLSFALESRKQGPRVGERLVAIGADKDRPVAFTIVIEPGWKDVKLAGLDIPTHQGSIVIESLGEASDALVQAIDRLYATGIGAKTMQSATRFSGISLGGDPSRLDVGPAKIKLFFESEVSGRYAELFLNIDVQAKSIELNEKDEDYRRPVVLALSGL